LFSETVVDVTTGSGLGVRAGRFARALTIAAAT